MFDPETWNSVPFHFWSVVFFLLGSMIGSLLNVCIHRMPHGQSIISPPSHCPHCHYAIPFYLNIPILTWLWLRGRCANCQARISPRYLFVELLTGIAFLGLWWIYGPEHPWVALIYSVFVAGLIAATFIDLEHFIIPDEITLGGMVAGFALSAVIPALHFTDAHPESIRRSLIGIAVGGGVVYAVLRGGKALFGRQRIEFDAPKAVVFTETALHLPDQEVPFEEIFYRESDAIFFEAEKLELPDRCYLSASVRLSPNLLRINGDEFNPADIPKMTAHTSEIVVPREAMGLGDVKFMAAIGAFLGWQATLFSLMASAILGSVVGLLLIAIGKHEWSNRLPYGPYIAVAAAAWIYGARDWFLQWFQSL